MTDRETRKEGQRPSSSSSAKERPAPADKAVHGPSEDKGIRLAPRAERRPGPRR